jgi:hypothetical protein
MSGVLGQKRMEELSTLRRVASNTSTDTRKKYGLSEEDVMILCKYRKGDLLDDAELKTLLPMVRYFYLLILDDAELKTLLPMVRYFYLLILDDAELKALLPLVRYLYQIETFINTDGTTIKICSLSL